MRAAVAQRVSRLVWRPPAAGAALPHWWRRVSSRASVPCAAPRAAWPLLQPPEEADGGAIRLQVADGVDAEAEGVPTLAVIGPSRRGKSVLGCLLAGGDPSLFQQSHSSFQAMTSGAHMVEVAPGEAAGGAAPRLRIIDTEGLSHLGRSRGRREALVRQFLISTYLTSSWVIWLDSEVLSTSFFTTMWLVHDYVVDVLKVRDAAGDRLPRLMYIRTQETEVQQLEYRDQFGDFGAFFARALQEHEDADILRQMFSPGGLHGHSLPVWAVEDLKSFEAARFWDDGHHSPFKASVALLRERLLAPAEGGPPLMALGQLEQHLPRIARLEAFDPRDHEVAKVARLRAQLRATYGRVADGVGAAKRDPTGVCVSEMDAPDLLNIFDPEDRDVRGHSGRIDRVVEARVQAQCRSMRLEEEVALADPEIAAVLARFREVAAAFDAAAEAFALEAGPFAEREILLAAVTHWGLDAPSAAASLAADLREAEERFLAASGLTAQEMRRLNMHERARWRVEECVMRLRGKVAAKMRTLEGEAWDPEDVAPAVRWVWRLGEWRWKAPARDGKTQPKSQRPREYAVWADGASWVLYEERRFPKVCEHAGVPREHGTEVARALPLPGR